LRELLDLRDSVPWTTVAARVIARGVDGSARIVTPRSGSHDGVRVNMPVLTPAGGAGIVGRVIEAAPERARSRPSSIQLRGCRFIQRTRVQG